MHTQPGKNGMYISLFSPETECRPEADQTAIRDVEMHTAKDKAY
jgi:hypothetical protein